MSFDWIPFYQLEDSKRHGLCLLTEFNGQASDLIETFSEMFSFATPSAAQDFSYIVDKKINTANNRDIISEEFNIEFPVYKKGMTFWPQIKLFGVGTDSEFKAAKEGLQLLADGDEPNAERKPNPYKAHSKIPNYDSKSFWIGDLCADKIDQDRRQEFLRHSLGVPAGMIWSKNSQGFVMILKDKEVAYDVARCLNI